MSDIPNEPVCKRTPSKMSSSGELAQLKSDGNWIKKKTGFYLRRHKNAGTDHVPHDETDAVKEGNLLLQLHAAALGRRVRLRHHPEADVVPSPDSTREGNKDGSDGERKPNRAQRTMRGRSGRGRHGGRVGPAHRRSLKTSADRTSTQMSCKNRKKKIKCISRPQNCRP